MKKYARKCDISGKGMNEGYCIGDGEMHIETEANMIKHLRSLEENPLIEMSNEYLLKEAYDLEYYYFTDWYDTLNEEEEWYTKSGKLIES